MILKEITEFLRNNLRLTLSPEKTKITNLTRERARFLGVYFWKPKAQEAKVTRTGNAKCRINQTPRLYFAAPIQEILNKLENCGFIKGYKNKSSRLIPVDAITKLIYLDHQAIILRYNAIINGLLNYYSFVDNLSKFHQIIGYILRHSCAKTLARKFRLKSRARAFKKFGKNLSVRVSKKDPEAKARSNTTRSPSPTPRWPPTSSIEASNL